MTHTENKYATGDLVWVLEGAHINEGVVVGPDPLKTAGPNEYNYCTVSVPRWRDRVIGKWDLFRRPDDWEELADYLDELAGDLERQAKKLRRAHG